MFRIGDLVIRWSRPNEGRIILGVIRDCYHFVDFDFDNKTFFFNPTKAAFGIPLMELNFRKIGKIKNVKKFRNDITEVVKKHNESFDFAKLTLTLKKHPIEFK